MSTTWRRVLAGFITFVVTMYVTLGSVPAIAVFVRWIGTLADGSNFWMFPFILIMYLVPMVLLFCVFALMAMALHWSLCRWFGARFDY